jgi:hypothetical protein
MTPTRIHRRRIKGWRMPPNTVNVTRGPGSVWGNPFIVGTHGDAKTCVARFERLAAGLIDMATQPAPAYADLVNSLHVLRTRLHELRGKNLACWCAPDAPCHADVLLMLANKDT